MHEFLLAQDTAAFSSLLPSSSLKTAFCLLRRAEEREADLQVATYLLLSEFERCLRELLTPVATGVGHCHSSRPASVSGRTDDSPATMETSQVTGMLSRPECRRLLGDEQTLFFTVLVGPLGGINLRNLAWHGFVLPSEQRHQAALTSLAQARSRITCTGLSPNPGVRWSPGPPQWG